MSFPQIFKQHQEFLSNKLDKEGILSGSLEQLYAITDIILNLIKLEILEEKGPEIDALYKDLKQNATSTDLEIRNFIIRNLTTVNCLIELASKLPLNTWKIIK